VDQDVAEVRLVVVARPSTVRDKEKNVILQFKPCV
jgi:hypothetical protein